MKPNIKDVAKAAGVSIAMVSRTLTGRGYVKKEKRDKIQRIVRELGYHPSMLAKGLRDKRTKTLGLIFSWLDQASLADYFYREILSAVLETSAARGYQLLISNFVGRWDDDDGWRARQILNDSRVEGVLLLAPRVASAELVKMVKGSHARAILLCHTDKSLSFVDADQKGGMDKALDYLVSKGHKRFGFIAGELGLVSNASTRHKAFMEGAKVRGLPLDASLIRKGRFDRESGFNSMRDLLKLPQPPTAVIASSDLQALGALEAMQDTPKEKRPALISFDDRPEAAERGAQLTTLRQPFNDIGRIATEELIKSLEDKVTKTVQITLPMELVRRQSA